MEQEKFEDERTPLDMIECFSRCANFPRTVEGMQFLAQGLVKASRQTGVAMQTIVDACAAQSQYCPTDHDLMTVAAEIRAERKAESTPKAPLGCEVCRGSGWKSFQRPVSIASVAPYTADYADFCDCSRGQWMRMMERQRKEESAAKKKGKVFTGGVI